MKTDDLRIVRTLPLLAPALVSEEIPLTPQAAELVHTSRRCAEAILRGEDSRTLLVVGPCSIHDPVGALEYAEKLKALADEVADTLFIVMRVYFEKPRTVIGWKGLINDPDLDRSYQINKGLRQARKVLADIAALGLATGTEFLDTILGQFYADLISWAAIGARTAESQIHRELASGLSMPVGIKNRTDGDIQIAVDAILAAREPHIFPSLTKDGKPAILETLGNPDAHLVLRGGTETGPNFGAGAVSAALGLLHRAGLPEILMIDCSHGNSGKDPQRQIAVVDDVISQHAAGQRGIRALMLESHLVAGSQDVTARPLTYGQSVTDACLGFDDTAALLRKLAGAL
jgi:3-deoxy-7-phosphoheptulonate synthase